MASIASPVVLQAKEFAEISALVYRLCGINLQPGKEGLVQTRLSKRVHALELSGFREYLDHVAAEPGGGELAHMVDLLTTNKTDFFREPQHFDFLRERILPGLAAGRSLRVWSAGCSSGEEPYTLSIVLREAIPDLARWDVRILATDLSARVLATAREGVYAEGATSGLTPRQLQRWFSLDRASGSWRAADELRGMIRFARLNLMDPWPMRGPFDVIFCRNVMIYFDKSTQERLVGRFHELLADGGHLFTGHSESLNSLSHPFRYVQPAVYQK